MPDELSPRRSHQTLIVVALAVAALIGAVSGAVSATLVSGGLQGSRFLLPLVGSRDVDPQIGKLLQEENATISVVDQVTKSVVSVVIKMRRGDLGEDAFAYDAVPDPNEVPPALMTEKQKNQLVETGGGTGFFVSGDGYIVTNRHVVSDEGAVFSVVTNDGVELPATVVAVDPFLDLAILDVEGDNYPTVPLGDSDAIRIGQTAIAVGNTLSEYHNTVTKGVISGINRRVVAGDETGEEVLERAIQTDAAINPGNSGGPLINLLGEVVGVNTAISYEGESLGFAIPINDIKKDVDDVEQFGKIVRPWLGVQYQMLDDATAKAFSIPVTEGALLVSGETPADAAVITGSPAADAGLKEGDVIVAVDGQALTVDDPLGPMISQYYPGDVVTLDVVRGDTQFQTNITLGEFPTP